MSVSGQLRIIGGPVEIIDRVQDTLANELKALLAERVKYGLDIPDHEAEMILGFFKSRCRKHLSQGILDAYVSGRYEDAKGKP